MDISKFIAELLPGRDVIVKSSHDLPEVPLGADVDIYSLEAETLIQSLVQVMPLGNIDLKATVRSVDASHYHLDLEVSGVLQVRFDIYQSFPSFERFSVKPNFFHEIVAASFVYRGNNNVRYPRPNKLHDAYLRYLEYCEFYWTGPDKLHHLQWIMQELDEAQRIQLFDLTHRTVGISLRPPNNVYREGFVKRIIISAGQNRLLRLITPKSFATKLARYARSR